ncbi:MAG: DUF3515 domain-containing protein [Actinomycetes bacterium]|jgi:hypothetical protein
MPRRSLLGIFLAGTVLVGCGQSGVPVVAPTPAGVALSQCTALIKALPVKLAGQSKRSALPPSSFTTAWGTDPITLRCGVGKPDAFDAQSQLLRINNTEWFVQAGSAATTFTLVNRLAYVEITVPQSYSPQADVITDLSGTIDKNVEFPRS